MMWRGQHTVSTKDGLKLHVVVCAPPADAKGVVLLVHGYAEHCGRYGEFVTRMSAAGYGVVMYDVRGHGKSEGARGHVLNWQQYSDDIDTLLKFAADQAQKKPLFLFGHSNGGLQVLRRLVDNNLPVPVRAAITTSPFMAPALAVNPVIVGIGTMLSYIVPTLNVNVVIPAEYVSRDPEEVQKYATDPLNIRDINTRWSTEASKCQAHVMRNIDKLSISMIVVQGGDDKIASVPATRALVALNTDKIMYYELERYYHEILNEPLEDRDKVYKLIIDQLDVWSASPTDHVQ